MFNLLPKRSTPLPIVFPSLPRCGVIICILSAGLLVLVLASCGSDDSPEDQVVPIQTNVGPNGTISPILTTVDYGDTATFTITADAGYQISSVSGCGGTLSGTVYTTEAVTAGCAITANFTLILPEVKALFLSAQNWNDYRTGLDGFSNADGRACNAENDSACLHGGEWRVVDVVDKTNCSNLSASDALGAFVWVCDDHASGVRFISTGLAGDKHLSSLIDFETPRFKTNGVTVYENGEPFGETPSTIWWDNPVELNNKGGRLDSEEGTMRWSP